MSEGAVSADDRPKGVRLIRRFAPARTSWVPEDLGIVGDGVIQTLGYGSTSPDVSGLNRDLETLRSKVEELRSEVVTNEQFSQLNIKIQELVQLADRAKEQGKELQAPVVLPPIEDMTVKLVPSHLLERLGEYQQEKGVALLLLGTFLGGILGIAGNWATNLSITQFSLVLMGLFVFLALGAYLWMRHVSARAAGVTDRMLRHAVAAQSGTRQDSNVPQ